MLSVFLALVVPLACRHAGMRGAGFGRAAQAAQYDDMLISLASQPYFSACAHARDN